MQIALNILFRQKIHQHYDKCHFLFCVKTRTSRTYLKLNLGYNTSLRRKYSEEFVPHHSFFFFKTEVRLSILKEFSTVAVGLKKKKIRS